MTDGSTWMHGHSVSSYRVSSEEDELHKAGNYINVRLLQLVFLSFFYS